MTSRPPICSAKGCRRPPSGRCSGTTRSCTRRTVARPGWRATSTGQSLGRLPGRPELPARGRAPGRAATARTLPAQPPMADIGRSGWRNVGSSMPWPARLPRIATTQRSASSRRSAPARSAPQVGLLAGEQAVADLAVGGQPHPVAVAAERAGDRGDDADGGRAAVDEEQLGRGAPPRLGRPGSASNSRSRRAKISSAVTISVAAPAVLGVERHLLDEAQLVAVLEAQRSSSARLVVVDAAQQHGVDLDRREARVARRPRARRSRRAAGRGG